MIPIRQGKSSSEGFPFSLLWERGAWSVYSLEDRVLLFSVISWIPAFAGKTA